MAHRRTTAAFTRRELVVVIVVLVVLGRMLVASLERRQRITCINNLKEVGTAYRIWSNDNGDKFPAVTPMTNGGWSDLLYRTNASTYYWANYVAMAAELQKNPRILVCPADKRQPANFLSNLANTNISYFIGVDANDTYPQAILGGDRNLGPGTTPDPEYGFSPSDGRGNDVTINGAVCWSLKMHSRGNRAGAGNILLGDGSAQQVTSVNMTRNWLKPEIEAPNANGKATNAAGVRLIFP